MERVGRCDIMERDLFVLELGGLADAPDQLLLSSSRFACLLAWDARGVPADAIARLARFLLDQGAVYVCAWGPDCERVHDIVDEEDVGIDPDPSAEGVVMTTSHADDSLAEALWFVLNLSWPDDAYASGCDSTLGISVGSSAWAAEIRDAFSDPRRFSKTMVERS